MLVTNHVLSGALIGAVTRRPAIAFALGVASHFALDAAPHWGDWGDDKSVFLRVAIRDGLTGLATIGALTALAQPPARVAVLAGMAGAALPDLDKPSILFFGRSPFPRVVDKFHSDIQREARHRFPVEVATGIGFVVTLAVLGLRARRAAR
ncbi:MAG: hypothetical protein JWM19_5406 [Actinomycetia bacterium]|nr:hypothetical protein [Actinomycetes bacterium]